MSTYVNIDPTLSEVEFLRSVLRQISHILRCTRGPVDDPFTLAWDQAMNRIEDVIRLAEARPSADADIIRQLRSQIGDLTSRLIDEGLSIKELGLARAQLAEARRTRLALEAQIAAQAAQLDQAHKAGHD